MNLIAALFWHHTIQTWNRKSKFSLETRIVVDKNNVLEIHVFVERNSQTANKPIDSMLEIAVFWFCQEYVPVFFSITMDESNVLQSYMRPSNGRSRKTACAWFLLFICMNTYILRFALLGCCLLTYLCDRFPVDFVLLLVNNVQWNGTILSLQMYILCLDYQSHLLFLSQMHTKFGNKFENIFVWIWFNKNTKQLLFIFWNKWWLDILHMTQKEQECCHLFLKVKFYNLLENNGSGHASRSAKIIFAFIQQFWKKYS